MLRRMSGRTRRAACVALLAAGCTAPVEPPKVVTAPPTKTPSEPARPQAPSQYVVRLPTRSSQNVRFELDMGRVGMVVRGSRWILDARGAPVGVKDDGMRIDKVAPIDPGAGGGFFFFTSTGLYRARD